MKSSGGLKSQISLPGRNVLPRDLRTNSEIEIYYGKPGIFYLDKMLGSQNVIVYPEDIVQVFPDPSLGIGAKITIYRATPVVVNDAGARKVYRTWAKTVQEFLDEKAIEIGNTDIVEPKQETFLSKNMEIRITRVSETTFAEKIGLDFKKIKQDDPNLEKGKTRIVQVGKPGIKERIYRIRRENGKEVSRVLVKEQVVVPPQDEITAYGTKKVITVRCKYNDWVLEAANKYSIEPDDLCRLMMKESNGNPDSVGFWGGSTYGLFQYKIGFWDFASAKAGFYGVSWRDPRAQIFTTAWALANGYRKRWP